MKPFIRGFAHIAEGEATMCAAVESSFTTGSVRSRIIAVLGEAAGLTTSDIAYHTASNKNTVRRTLSELKADGVVIENGRRYRDGKSYDLSGKFAPVVPVETVSESELVGA